VNVHLHEAIDKMQWTCYGKCTQNEDVHFSCNVHCYSYSSNCPMHSIRPILRCTLCFQLRFSYHLHYAFYQNCPPILILLICGVTSRGDWYQALVRQRSAFSFKGLLFGHFYPWKWDDYFVSKCLAQITQHHRATSEKNEGVETNRGLLDMQQVQEMLRFTGRHAELIIRTVIRKCRNSPKRTETHHPAGRGSAGLKNICVA
jgi:hypothetical protein